MEEKPRVVEGIVLDRDGAPISTPESASRDPSGPGIRLFKPSPLLIAGAVIAIPLLLALLLAFGAFMLLMTLVTGRRPRIVRFSNISGFARR